MTAFRKVELHVSGVSLEAENVYLIEAPILSYHIFQTSIMLLIASTGCTIDIIYGYIDTELFWHVVLRTFLRKEGIHKIPLAQFVGNRNILFYDAAGVYFLRDYMKRYIETVHGAQANRLLQAVLADLKDCTYISGCRALG